MGMGMVVEEAPLCRSGDPAVVSFPGLQAGGGGLPCSFPDLQASGRLHYSLSLSLCLLTRRRARGGALPTRGKQLSGPALEDGRREGNNR
jgi:hypothetical protein